MDKRRLNSSPGLPVTGRKSASIHRNRSALIQATQRVLATIGPEATIDDVAGAAEISVSTIYKHFESREILFSAALVDAMNDWESWALSRAIGIKDPVEQMVLPLRLFIRLHKTHPFYRDLVAANLSTSSQLIPILGEGLSKHIKALVRSGHLAMDNAEIRIRNFQGAIFAIISHQLRTATISDSEGDLAIEIALELLNLSQAKARKLMSLDNLPRELLTKVHP